MCMNGCQKVTVAVLSVEIQSFLWSASSPRNDWMVKGWHSFLHPLLYVERAAFQCTGGFVSPVHLNYLVFLCGGGMFKKRMLKYWWRWEEERLGAGGKMNQKLTENLNISPHTPSLSSSCLSTIHPLPLSPPRLRQNMTFLIFPLAGWSLGPPLPLCLPFSFIFNAPVSCHLEPLSYR